MTELTLLYSDLFWCFDQMTSRLFSQSFERYCLLTTSPITPSGCLPQLKGHCLPHLKGRFLPNSSIRTFTHSHKTKLQRSQTRSQSKISKDFPEAMEAIKQTVAQNLGIKVHNPSIGWNHIGYTFFTMFHARPFSTVTSFDEIVLTSIFTQGAHDQVPESQKFDLKDTPDLKGKVAVITGGSEGIGYGASHTLLSHGIEKLFILSVSQEVVDGSINAIKEEMGEEIAKRVTWLQCDLSDWKKVKQTADKIASSTDRIDILINNAARGIMTYQLTDYGVDRHVSLVLLW